MALLKAASQWQDTRGTWTLHEMICQTSGDIDVDSCGSPNVVRLVVRRPGLNSDAAGTDRAAQLAFLRDCCRSLDLTRYSVHREMASDECE